MSNKSKVTKKSTSQTVKRTAARTPKKNVSSVPDEPIIVESNVTKAMPYILSVMAVFVLICQFISDTGALGHFLFSIFRGMNGSAVFAVPILMIIAAVLWRRRVRQGKLVAMIISQTAFLFLLSSFLHVVTKGFIPTEGNIFEWIKTLWNDGISLNGAGAVGGLFSILLSKLVDKLIFPIGIIGTIVTAPLCVGITPYAIYIRLAYAIKHKKAEKKEKKVLSQEEKYQNELRKQQEKYNQKISSIRNDEKEAPRVTRDINDKHRFTPDIDIDVDEYKEDDSSKLSQITVDEIDDEEEISAQKVENYKPNDEDEPPFDISVGTKMSGKQISRKKDIPMSSNGDTELDSIKKEIDKVDTFTSSPKVEQPLQPDLAEGQFISESELAMLNNFAKAQQENESKKNEMMAGKEGAEFISEEEETALPVKKDYVYPPISLLKYDLTPKNVDISDELTSNANKLVETLKSFKVETKLINISRGPAITRYELQPKEGVRVKQIANLVDDIALNLATTGVRIEAPIPGKAAVGVEVPNKTISTVYLRELVDTETFKKAASKLNVCLGVDVAGEPVYLDIAKMPHLLIAGATGMGKSVCINSIITSILYKSSPDDVKMILIDPKKVEFDIYTGLPHLLVPVVSDPKQAAGALQWAVAEMERRFDLIGSVGVRDVKMYNQVTADDFEKEHLCSIVIIIDELADLMMTAPDDVEASICRLAQKARAAGMHIIIGTQRPSVDVITGLIKANVPSRIAFTVASQTDSRVVLDMAGAEKLIGRGDMLYAPVGSPKPRRVQGSYVSESETEAIVNFIKENNSETEYDSSVSEAIERNAAACGNKKGSGGGITSAVPESDDGDPMLRQAIELALESGKISTSLIQRRLSLGYGRAAKLIDEMEKMGIVSAPEGQKPRNVLISKQQYMEMFVSRGEELGING